MPVQEKVVKPVKENGFLFPDPEVSREDEPLFAQIEKLFSIASDEAKTNSQKQSAIDRIVHDKNDKFDGTGLEDVEKMIPSKEKRKFIADLFKKNSEDYQRTINLLSYMRNWKSANKLLELCFTERGINPYSKDALEFGKIIYLRYFPEEIGFHKGKKLKF